ncbi:Uncharacterized protein TCM_039429 [Theobroma cacao]|uniref:Uncharacterized protein n=1 Tax=Theobroma cacao TaxID=3641 RepID=A0A061GS69_THECC|nr:Uncharacterized protein TCM_039429 [Theobroma cacao]
MWCISKRQGWWGSLTCAWASNCEKSYNLQSPISNLVFPAPDTRSKTSFSLFVSTKISVRPFLSNQKIGHLQFIEI